MTGGLGLKIFSTVVAGTALIGSLVIGPIDLARTVYNLAVGDLTPLKRELIDYSRRDLVKEHHYASPEQIEFALAVELGTDLEGRTKINPDDVSMSRLWDASEDHRRSWYQGWIWPDMED